VTLRRSFSVDPTSVAASRRFVGDAVVDLPTDIQEAAVLMVSELATNAIVHATTGFEVTIDRTTSKLRVEVADLGGGEPELQMPSVREPHGRGLQIVRELSDEWGITENADNRGKTVWYEVRVGPARLLDSDDPTTPEATRRKAHQQSGRAPRTSPRALRQKSDPSNCAGADAAPDGYLRRTTEGHEHPCSCRWVPRSVA
jgi:anti-sigma regulatory factor (Ser/Thr protein kinase)